MNDGNIMMTKIFARILLFFSRLIVRRYRPKIIGITGSVGKTSTKGAICAVLSSRFRVRQSIKSYNNEIGVPLTIIGSESANRSIVGWLGIIFKAIRLILWKDPAYPEMLVLEMDADQPGDIAYLTRMAPCDVGVLTAIAPAHLEKFETIENIATEKRVIIKHLRPGAVAILNGDNALVAKTPVPSGVIVFTYGFGDSVDVRGSDMMISRDSESSGLPVRGVSFKISYSGSSVPTLLSGVIGRPAALSALAATAMGLHFGLNLVDITRALQNIKTPPGRLRLIKGINNTLIIDDSYNSSPAAALMAIETFTEIHLPLGAKRYAVLGDMLELGSYSEAGHEEVGRRGAEGGVDVLATVGERARTICRAARLVGFDSGSMFCFAEAMEAVRFLEEHIGPGDAMLIKGSQAMRMERIVKELMAEPERARELLVRQGPEWQKI